MRHSLLLSLVILAAGLISAQTQPGQPANPSGAPLTAEQLDNLVAPIALYPDPLLSQIFAASTYPIEIAEAQQWVRDHPKWKPSKLMDEAKKEQWDPSVQGLVAFPEVLTRLSQDIGWTTQLGNAFLAQQADVMQAVQRMRASAQAKGTLQTTPQEVVNTQEQNGQRAITIEPANPDIWYVPNYNPVFIWGPPVWGYYPPIFYPGVDVGFSFFPGIDIGLYFGGWGGWGWGGWGWGPDWFGGVIFINHSFFHRYGFEHFHGEPLGRSSWAHNPEHRLGVPYANRGVAARYGTGAESRGLRGAEPGNREFRTAPPQRFGTPNFEQRGYTNNHSVFGGYHNGTVTRSQSDHGFSSIGAGRSGGFGGGGGFHGGGGVSRGGGGRR
ncbi:MAG TPA: DUF3300 domain-containing protein [Bryobacteraceae bacterium]|nr:DUF3300 domain-containing protein [Bryobacteraceae bacterium]